MPFKPARFLDPKSDVVFKKIFGQHPDLMKSFLNSILPLSEDQMIDHLEYLNPEQTPRIPTMKNTIVDVKCTDQCGRIFIVEMQMQWAVHFKKRLLFGVSKAFVQQLDAGENYHSLCPVYGLGIVNDAFDEESEDWFHHYRSINVQRPERVLEGLELIFIELPKFKPQTWQEKKLGILWLRFLKEIGEKTFDVDADFLSQPDLSKALELSQESGYSKAELEAYDKYWDAVSCQKTYISGAFDKGKVEGILEGKLDVARKLLKSGMDQTNVALLTDLTLKQLDGLK